MKTTCIRDKIFLGLCLLATFFFSAHPLVHAVTPTNLPENVKAASSVSIFTNVWNSKIGNVEQVNMSLDDAGFVFTSLEAYDGVSTDQIAVKYFSSSTHTNLTNDNNVGHSHPHLSPDADLTNKKYTIAYISRELTAPSSGTFAIQTYYLQIMDVDGTTVTDTRIDTYYDADGNRDRNLELSSYIGPDQDTRVIAWSPDGSKIAFVARPNFTSEPYMIFVKEMRPSGRTIFRASAFTTLGIMSQPSVYPVTTTLASQPENLTWSPDGKSIYFNMSQTTGYHKNFKGIYRQKIGGMMTQYITDSKGSYDPFILSSDGKYILAVQEDTYPKAALTMGEEPDPEEQAKHKQPIVAIDVDTGKKTTFLEGFYYGIRKTQYDNYAIVVDYDDAEKRQNLYLLNLTTKSLEQITHIKNGEKSFVEYSVGTKKLIYVQREAAENPDGGQDFDVVTVKSFTVGDDANDMPTIVVTDGDSDGDGDGDSGDDSDCECDDGSDSGRVPAEASRPGSEGDGTALDPNVDSGLPNGEESGVGAESGDGSSATSGDGLTSGKQFTGGGCTIGSSDPIQMGLNLLPLFGLLALSWRIRRRKVVA